MISVTAPGPGKIWAKWPWLGDSSSPVRLLTALLFVHSGDVVGAAGCLLGAGPKGAVGAKARAAREGVQARRLASYDAANKAAPASSALEGVANANCTS